jgi:hypothetical protein
MDLNDGSWTRISGGASGAAFFVAAIISLSAATLLARRLYIQHSAHIPPGREGLFELVKAVPTTMRYENAVAVAEVTM